MNHELRRLHKTFFSAFVALAAISLSIASACGAAKPNIVYFVIDELGYYELSHKGHPEHRTPNIDRLAAEGMQFTQCLAGGPVCAPTRCALLTGKHAGHMTVRANGGFDPLREGEETLGSMLKRAGYATGGFGKWGNGARGTSGVPEKHGFDIFFGYYDQVHAHTYFPRYLVRNSQEAPLVGNTGDTKEGRTFSPNVDPKTGVKFCGFKGQLYEGGLRVPFIAHWPGRIAGGRVSDHLCYFPDVMPTLAELTGAVCPKDTDGLSFVPVLLGEQAAGRKQPQHEFLYWEHRQDVAVRSGPWKATRPGGAEMPWELYDLSKDISESKNVAAQHVDILEKMKAFAAAAHQPNQPGEVYDRALVEKDRNYLGLPAGETKAKKAGKGAKKKTTP